MEEKCRIELELPDSTDISELFGNLDANIKQVEDVTCSEIILRNSGIVINGGNYKLAADMIKGFTNALERGQKLDRQTVGYIIDNAAEGIEDNRKLTSKDVICYTHQGKPLLPKTKGQRQYVENIRKNDMVFGIGPAGTGKTYLACAMAVNAYKNKEVEKIILARPAVEAGESLGFLPGDLQEKVDPYLRPLYDAIFEIMGQDAAAKLKEREAIEVVPLAYMRGRTLDNSFIILDEAQNTTCEQMKMFLTRMGFHSKVVVTGDITQIDLPRGKKSGLKEACKILKDINGIEFTYLNEIDVVRHELVKKIIKAYSEYESKRKNDNMHNMEC